MQNDSRNALTEILTFVLSRVQSGQMTLEEVNSWVDIILGSCTIWATAEELAAFYGQSEQNVRSLINRRYVGKPKRRVYYSFNLFSRIVPQSWKSHKKTTENQPISNKM